MSSLSLPPDPYKALGVSKDAKLPEIRSAHRKLVLQCHPDKVQDPALKAIKQDEFQKVQQAYEVLNDDTKRLQYDELVKLHELRKEMGRGVPTARSNPFEYQDKPEYANVRTAEPRPNVYETRSPSYTRPMPNVYAHQPVHRSHEDIMYEDRSHHHPKKSASYDSSTDRRRASEKEDRYRAEDLLQRKREEERAREKEIKRAHGDKKKSRDKEKRKGTEDKHSRTSGPYVEDLSDEYSPRPSERKPTRQQVIDDDVRRRQEDAHRARQEEEIYRMRMADEMRRRDLERENDNRLRAEAEAREARRKKEALQTPKSISQEEYLTHYMGAAKRKGEAEQLAANFAHPGMRRSETYAAPSTRDYNVRDVAPPHDFSDDDSPRRSSVRRTSETPVSRRDGSKAKRSPSTKESPFFVAEPAPTPTRKPAFVSQNSAPPVLSRKEPSRSQTQDYPSRAPTMPTLPRASTLNESQFRERGIRSSGLKKEVIPESDEGDFNYRSSPQRSSSPPRQRAESRYADNPGEKIYKVSNGRAVPKSAESARHRSDLHTLDEDYVTFRRDESPHQTSSRPSLARMSSSEKRPRGGVERGTSYHIPIPDPYVNDAYAKDAYANVSYVKTPEIINAPHRPPMVSRESSNRVSQYDDTPKVRYTAPIKDIKYGTADIYGQREPRQYSSYRGSSVHAHG